MPSSVRQIMELGKSENGLKSNGWWLYTREENKTFYLAKKCMSILSNRNVFSRL